MRLLTPSPRPDGVDGFDWRHRHLVTGVRRSYRDAPTAGSIWDTALGSDSPLDDLGLALLDGVDSDAPATVTTVTEQSNLSTGVYQPATVERVEVAGRTLYVASQGYSEGYAYYLRATLDGAKATIGLPTKDLPCP